MTTARPALRSSADLRNSVAGAEIWRKAHAAIDKPSNISNAARFCLRVKPNSAAALMLLTVSPPALAKPMTLAPEVCACNKKAEKSLVLKG